MIPGCGLSADLETVFSWCGADQVHGLNLCIAIILSAPPGFNQRMTRKSVHSYTLHALGKLAL